MASAAVLSCEQVRPTLAKTRARPQRHEHVDRWLATVEAHVSAAMPSLEDWTQAVLGLRQEVTGRITEAVVAQSHARPLQQRTLGCPNGHRLLPARPVPPRAVHTLVGEVARSRPYCYGPGCQQGCAPLDDALQLAQRRTHWDLQQAAARLAAEVPCQIAQELFTPLTGRALSDPPIQAVAGELRHELGVLEVSPTAVEIAHRVAERAAGHTWRPVLGGAIDGACVPTRPEPAQGPALGRRPTRAQRAPWHGAWQEAKGVRFSVVDTARLVHLLSWSQVGCDEAGGAARRPVKEAGVIPAAQGRMCVIGAGAQWSWTPGHTLVPTAGHILAS